MSVCLEFKHPYLILVFLLFLNSCGDSGGGNPPGSGPLTVNHAHTIQSPTPNPLNEFGSSVVFAPDNGSLIVGEVYGESSAPLTDSGRIHVFNTGTNWIRKQSLDSEAAVANNNFGFAVALSPDGSTLVSAETLNAGGNIQFHTVNLENWIWVRSLPDIARAVGNRFGYSLDFSADGNSLAVGEYNGDINANAPLNEGLVTVYSKSPGATWEVSALTEDTLQSNQPAEKNGFGSKVRFSPNGNYVAVSEKEAEKVHIFKRVVTGWSWIQAINSESFSFGNSLDFSPDSSILAIGSPDASVNISLTWAGKVRLYRLNGETWQEFKTLTAATPAAGNNFGIAIRFSNNGLVLAVGETFGGNDSEGLVHLFRKNADEWLAGPILHSDSPSQDNEFGNSLAFSPNGKYLAVGERFGDPLVDPANSGLVHLFEIK